MARLQDMPSDVESIFHSSCDEIVDQLAARLKVGPLAKSVLDSMDVLAQFDKTPEGSCSVELVSRWARAASDVWTALLVVEQPVDDGLDSEQDVLRPAKQLYAALATWKAVAEHPPALDASLGKRSVGEFITSCLVAQTRGEASKQACDEIQLTQTAAKLETHLTLLEDLQGVCEGSVWSEGLPNDASREQCVKHAKDWTFQNGLMRSNL